MSSRGRPLRIAALAVLCALAVLSTGGQPAAAQSPAEQQLAETYSPIVLLKQQKSTCDTEGEPYDPAPVEIILGDAEVRLRDTGEASRKSDPLLATGPRGSDLASAAETTYLDLPGNPRNPGCGYARYSQSRMATLQPTTYAHIVVDGEAGKLVLQYWFYYVFNDFNNTHESDWEMIQLVFQAGSAEEALAETPVTIGYAQHGGGELADWGDDKLRFDGSHPIVYPAAGSHGSYFSSATFIGWGENGTGFGCDDTTGPSRRLALTPVLVPADPDPAGPFAWLRYQGRWGERQPWEFNGPKGPNLGKKWTDPLGAMENWRSSSLEVPASRTLGPTATDVFCTVTEGGSRILIISGVYPWVVLAGLGLALGVAGLLLARAWPLFAAAIGMYRRHWRTFLGIGLLTIPIGWLFNGFQALIDDHPPVEWMLDWLNDTGRARLALALTIGGVQQLAMLLLIGPAVIQAVTLIDAGRVPSAQASYREGFRHLGLLALTLLVVFAALAGLGITIIGIPLAVWLFVRWQFFGQAVVMGRAPTVREALRTSTAAVRGRWLRVLGASLVIELLGALPGPLIGVVLLIFGKRSVQFANGVSSFIYAVMIPVAVIALTILYERRDPGPVPEPEQVPEAPSLAPQAANP